MGDEIVNINGKRLRGVGMDTARQILSQCSRTAEAVVARTEVSEEAVKTEDKIVLWQEGGRHSFVLLVQVPMVVVCWNTNRYFTQYKPV